jgi:hypothetical protein
MAVPPQRLSVTNCNDKAQECRDMARVATKPEHRIMLQHMAETWDRIAADVSDNKQDN